jgi:hypothetical protein
MSGLKVRAPAFALGALLLVAVDGSIAQSSGGNFTLRKQAAVPGGRSAAANIALSQSLSEPGAGAQAGGSYRLTGGLQTPRITRPDAVFANGFE